MFNLSYLYLNNLLPLSNLNYKVPLRRELRIAINPCANDLLIRLRFCTCLGNITKLIPFSTWPYGQAVKTAPSQGAITSSILVRVTTTSGGTAFRGSFFVNSNCCNRSAILIQHDLLYFVTHIKDPVMAHAKHRIVQTNQYEAPVFSEFQHRLLTYKCFNNSRNENEPKIYRSARRART